MSNVLIYKWYSTRREASRLSRSIEEGEKGSSLALLYVNFCYMYVFTMCNSVRAEKMIYACIYTYTMRKNNMESPWILGSSFHGSDRRFVNFIQKFPQFVFTI
ncbi:unnamed protein product [Lepeophtheirus salmonis]|uniref:(salmon louse) hypothetical protein n=1 Tax=Lepeophtheirus salmonis TaxID=72036 RepID=A0A7R8CZL5_LEPSM|nr:unnamed protein product [Lepeophtheirus salmonis]CAF2975824.1 unnamed protein product [Lepeophtheirus salmonis]